MSEDIIHKRFVTFTQPLIEELEKLGYKLVKTEGHGMNKTRTYKKDNKFVDTSHNQLMLYVKDKLGIPHASHMGLTVHDEMLKFFTQRTPSIPDNDKANI